MFGQITRAMRNKRVYHKMPAALIAAMKIFRRNSDNNDYTNLVFFAFLKEYSILGSELKDNFLLKSRCLMKG